MRNANKYQALFRLVLFLIPLLLASFYLNRCYMKNQLAIDPPLTRGINILILGDSHAAFALDPGFIDRAFNFSSYGESYIHNYYKLKYALRHAPGIQVVILPIDLHSFSDFRKDRIHFTPDWYRYLNYVELGWRKKRLVSYLLNDLKLGLFEFRGNTSFLTPSILKKKNPPPSRQPSYGFTPQTGFFFQNQNKKARNRAYRQLKGFNTFSGEMEFYFRKILDLCETHHLQVILLKLPVSRAYFDVASRLINVDRYYGKIFALTRHYKNIHTFDFQKLYFGNQSGLFWDPQHLNSTGSRDISTIVGKRIKNLNLVRSRD